MTRRDLVRIAHIATIVVREIYRTAITWATKQTYLWNGRPLLLMAALSLLGFTLGFRRGLAYLVPWLTVVGFLWGTGVFAEYYPDYQSIGGSLQRLEIIIPLVAAMVAIALEAELAAASTPVAR